MPRAKDRILIVGRSSKEMVQSQKLA